MSTELGSSEARPLELAVLCDLREENWPSMDLVADKLLGNLVTGDDSTLHATRICPPMKIRFARVSRWRSNPTLFNVDRLLNRMYDYPVYVGQIAHEFELFHICDHSYAQLVHSLPSGRTGVFCHDLDTFKCLLEPDKERRPLWFKAMTRRILQGLESAALVFYTTSTVRAQIERHNLVDTTRLVQAPYGISEEFNPASLGDESATDVLLRSLNGAPFLLHVGSCIPRKRIDVLLSAFAEARLGKPELRLLQVGGEWSKDQSLQITRLGLETSILQLPRMSQRAIATLYRRAELVLMPSESEGFGLPVVEALACGCRVIASDISVFREVGGDAVTYCPMGDAGLWAETILRLLTTAPPAPELERRLQWATQFTWPAHVQRIATAYRGLLG